MDEQPVRGDVLSGSSSGTPQASGMDNAPSAASLNSMRSRETSDSSPRYISTSMQSAAGRRNIMKRFPGLKPMIQESGSYSSRARLRETLPHGQDARSFASGDLPSSQGTTQSSLSKVNMTSPRANLGYPVFSPVNASQARDAIVGDAAALVAAASPYSSAQDAMSDERERHRKKFVGGNFAPSSSAHVAGYRKSPRQKALSPRRSERSVMVTNTYGSSEALQAMLEQGKKNKEAQAASVRRRRYLEMRPRETQRNRQVQVPIEFSF